jgi:ubiquinone/menaquinone biosynthesis C-methylase UbiE
LPFAAASFDGLLCSYVLDLIPIREIPDWLAGFRRVLKPGGRIVLVSLTEGVNGISKTFVSLWKLAYAISPIICAGCRPLRLEELVQQAGFNQIDWHVIVQLGVPSQVIAAVG